MMRRTVRWIAVVAALAVLGWAAGVATNLTKALLDGRPLDPSMLAPSRSGWLEAAYAGFSALVLLADWLVRRRARRPGRLVNGGGYNMVFFLADLTGATRAGVIIFSLGIAAVAMPALYRIPDSLALARLPWLAQFAAAFMVGTFVHYWWHRFMHTRLMWPLHAIHHSDRDFGVLTFNRRHPLEVFLFDLSVVVALVLLGIEIRVMIVVVVVSVAFSALQHCNLPFPLWAERWIVFGPAGHRVHHSTAADHHHRNFALLPLWDRMFGTFLLPADARQTPTGIDDPRYDTGRPFHELVVSARIWLAGLAAAFTPKAFRRPATAR
jgi:sterol desaturase/sphingolipid hydroxylase (fatty acid hydroxylase superfamily)